MSSNPIPSSYRDDDVRHFEWDAQNASSSLVPQPEDEGGEPPKPPVPIMRPVEFIPPESHKMNDESPSFFV